MRFLTSIFNFSLIIVVIAFAILNSKAVTINFIIMYADISLSLVLVCAFFLGLSIGLFSSSVRYWKLNKKLKSLNHQLEHKDVEINNLRNAPVNDGYNNY